MMIKITPPDKVGGRIMKRKKLLNYLARRIMREILRNDGLDYSKVDYICMLIPIDASICRITGNVIIDDLPEGKELFDVIKQNMKSFEFGCNLENIFFSNKNYEKRRNNY